MGTKDMNLILANLLLESAETIPLAKVGDQPLELFEYVALKQEQATRIALRETALYANLAASASLLAVYFESTHPDIRVLLLLPFFSVIMFWIYWNNDFYISTIGRYVSEYLAHRIAAHVLGPHNQNKGKSPSSSLIFAWERAHKTASIGRVLRRLFGTLVLFVSFVAPPVTALVALAMQPQLTGLAWWLWSAGAAATAVLAVTFIVSGVAD